LAAGATSTTDSASNPANRFASLVSGPSTAAQCTDPRGLREEPGGWARLGRRNAVPASFVPRRPRLESAAAREGEPMKSRAAVANQAGKPLSVETVEVEGPHAGEVLVEIHATGICHTDEFTLSGADPEGLFPAVLGHEGAGVVIDVGAGVTSVKKGDHVI